LRVDLSFFYKRSELGKRVAIYYSSSSLSGAFSGLLSYAIFHIKSDKLAGWQILFIIEGGLTICVAIVAFFVLPGYPSTVKFLTPEEKKVAIMRYVHFTLPPKDECILAKFCFLAGF
jgi:MFS family permease